MVDISAYLLAKTCTLVVFAAEADESVPRLISEQTFRDTEQCDWLVAQGVQYIQIVNRGIEDVTDYGRSVEPVLKNRP